MGTAKELRGRVQAAVASLGWTAHDLACVVGPAYSTVGRYLDDDYLETPGMREEMALFLARYDRGEYSKGDKVVSIADTGRVRGRRAERGERKMYETEMVRRVAALMDYAHENAEIVLITANFGCGKTESARMWRKKNRDVAAIFFEFDDYTASKKIDFLAALASAVGIEEPVHQGNTGRAFNEICARLRAEPALLIFDQLDIVKTRILQIIRQIWDRTNEEGVGVVLLAPPYLVARLQRERSTDLGALRSRIGARAALTGLERLEMAAILKQEGIDDVTDAAFALWFDAVQGSMRWLMKTVRLIQAKHKGKRVTERTVEGVCGFVGLLGALPARGPAGGGASSGAAEAEVG